MGPSLNNCVLDPLDVLHLVNRLYISEKNCFFFITMNRNQRKLKLEIFRKDSSYFSPECEALWTKIKNEKYFKKAHKYSNGIINCFPKIEDFNSVSIFQFFAKILILPRAMQFLEPGLTHPPFFLSNNFKHPNNLKQYIVSSIHRLFAQDCHVACGLIH